MLNKNTLGVVNVLPSKNQVLCTLNYLLLWFRKYNNVMRKSCEQRLITKEHIVTRTHLNVKLKPALYSSTLVIKLFTSSIKFYKLKFLL